DFEYSQIQPKGSDKKYIVASALLGAVAPKFGWDEYEVVATFTGKELEMVTTEHPFMDREILVVNADYVTADAGTGAVHTAPGFGEDDFATGQRYNMPVIM